MCTRFQELSFAKDTDSACLFNCGGTVDTSGGFDKRYEDRMGPTDE